MKLDVAVNEVVLSNVQTTGEFRIRNSAKAFKILSDGLYSNKIRAVIRELSCNAVDSHIAAGKVDVPFEVHLPTLLEPWFAVRDFGVGLDHDQVTNIYTTYFESTKTDSNDYIGALGLGSKSPFSYTENFTVTAIKGKMKRIYSAFINEVGVPSIAEMTSELTDEENGVEVKFGVTNSHDYNSFVHEAQQVFKWFKNKPTITGKQINHEEIAYAEENIIPGVHVLKRGYSTVRSVAVMGNIAYSLANISEPEKHFGSLATLLNCGLVMEFAIGELDFAASREELSFVPMTINSIRRKLEQLNDNLYSHFKVKADAVDGDWAKASFLYTESRNDLYKAAVVKYVTETKFPLYDSTMYHGIKTFNLGTKAMEDRGLKISGFQINHNGNAKEISKGHDRTVGECTQIPVDTDITFVLNDIKTGCSARAKYHFKQLDKTGSVYCISHSSDDMSVRQAEYEKLLAELHNPPNVIKASTMKKRPSTLRGTGASNGIAVLYVSSGRYYYSPKKYSWVPANEELSDDNTYYYVELIGHEPQESFDVNNTLELMRGCGVEAISNIKIYGVRKSRVKEISEMDNWVKLGDKLKEETSKISDADIIPMVIADVIDSYSLRAYTNANIAKKLDANSDYYKFVTKYNKKKQEGTSQIIAKLCERFGKSLGIEKVKADIEVSKKLVIAKYPMLQYASGAPEIELLQYIKMIDNLKTI